MWQGGPFRGQFLASSQDAVRRRPVKPSPEKNALATEGATRAEASRDDWDITMQETATSLTETSFDCSMPNDPKAEEELDFFCLPVSLIQKKPMPEWRLGQR